MRKYLYVHKCFDPWGKLLLDDATRSPRRWNLQMFLLSLWLFLQTYRIYFNISYEVTLCMYRQVGQEVHLYTYLPRSFCSVCWTFFIWLPAIRSGRKPSDADFQDPEHITRTEEVILERGGNILPHLSVYVAENPTKCDKGSNLCFEAKIWCIIFVATTTWQILFGRRAADKPKSR